MGESAEAQCGRCLLVLHTRESPSCGDPGNSEGEHHPLHYQDHSRETGNTILSICQVFIQCIVFYKKEEIKK